MRTRIQQVRRAMEAIRRQLDQLDDLGIDGRNWITLRSATSFEDWVAKTRARMADHRTLREALNDDLKVLRDNLTALELERHRSHTRRRNHRIGTGVSALPANGPPPTRAPPPPPVAAGTKPAPPPLPPGSLAKGDFAADVAAMLQEAQRTGTFDPAMLQAVRRECDEKLRGLAGSLRHDPSPANIEATLSFVSQAMLLGLGTGNAVTDALAEAGGAAYKNMKAASDRFAGNPSLENFKEKYHWMSEGMKLGVTNPPGLSPAPKRLRPAGKYVSKTGDTLPSISRQFYGTESGWEQIYWMNSGTLRRLEDPTAPLPPNTALEIP